MKVKYILFGLIFAFFYGCSSTGIAVMDETIKANITAPLNQEQNALLVEDFRYEIALGHIDGDTTWNKWGFNPDVDTATSPETIWYYGGIFTPLENATVLNISSDSAQDVTGGGGATSILIYGLNASRDSVIEVIFLNGTNTVQTQTEFLGINRVATYIAEEEKHNVGNIIVTNAGNSSDVQAYVPAEAGTTQQSIFFTQQDHTYLVDWLYMHVNKPSGGGTPKVLIKGWVYSFVSGSTYEIFRTQVDTTFEGTLQLTPSQPFVVGEKSVLYFTADTDTNNVEVNVRFSGIEVFQ